jgi:hypothetical protein
MIPRESVAPLLETCDWLVRLSNWEGPPEEIFKRFLGLMKKYKDYFFSEPWPLKYDHAVALAISQADEEFLLGHTDDDFADRETTVCIRKSIYMHGFMGYYGMKWVQDAISEKYFWPLYEKALACFDDMVKEGADAQGLVDSLEKDDPVRLLHNSLVHRLETSYPSKPERKFIGQVLVLLHSEKGVPECNGWFCSNHRKLAEHGEEPSSYSA